MGKLSDLEIRRIRYAIVKAILDNDDVVTRRVKAYLE